MERFLIPTFNKIIAKETLETPNSQQFTLEKLERGFGNTIGTAIRRVALSSIPGASAFAVEVKGIQHEFQAIPNAKEDMVEFILNLKDLVIEVDENIIDVDEVHQFKLSSLDGVVKAKNIEAPTGFNIYNKNLVIANTSKDQAIEATIYVMYSKGFKTFEDTRLIVEEKIGDIQGIIPIDANFSPIVKFNFNVSEVNPGESRIFERLTMDVETNGAMIPEKAVAFTGAILKNYYAAFEELFDEIRDENLFEEEVVEEDVDAQLSVPIESLNLSARSEKWLLASNIKYVQELINRPVSALKDINNLGEKSITEIIQVVQDMGLSFKSE